MEQRFINRELTWLAFNDRVLQLASEPGIPLLERAKFCAITTTNLDEFFQVRVAALKDQVAAGIEEPTADGMTATQQLAAISERTAALVARQDDVYLNELVPALAARRSRHRQLVRPRRRGPEAPRRGLRAAHLPRAHAARRRPEPPVPVHLQPRPQHRRDGRRPVRRGPSLRPRQGADGVPPPPRGRRDPLPARRRPHHRPAPHVVRRHGHRGGGRLPRHPQRRPDRRGGGGRRPARGRRDGAAPAALQPGGAPRGVRDHERRAARAADPGARSAPGRRVPQPRTDRPRLPLAAPRASTAPTSRTGPGHRSRPGGSPSPRSPTARCSP